jgi:hypothetical protein
MNTLLLQIFGLQMETAALAIRALLPVPRGRKRPEHLKKLAEAIEQGERLLEIAEQVS